MAYPLLTERLSIEPLATDDLQAFVRYRQDPAIARFQSWETSYSESQARDLIDSQAGLTAPDPGDWLQLAIHEVRTGELLGDLALHAIEDEFNAFEIGFTIAGNHQGKGVAREAAGRLIDFLLQEQKATVIRACTDRRNTPSIKLLLSLGFEVQPTKSWDEFFKNENVTVDQYELKGLASA
jgi:RimJ/RimL family protein N-acetyltransferase